MRERKFSIEEDVTSSLVEAKTLALKAVDKFIFVRFVELPLVVDLGFRLGVVTFVSASAFCR